MERLKTMSGTDEASIFSMMETYVSATATKMTTVLARAFASLLRVKLLLAKWRKLVLTNLNSQCYLLTLP